MVAAIRLMRVLGARAGGSCRVRGTALLLAEAGLAIAGPAAAQQQATTPARIGGAAQPGPCVAIDVAGQRFGQLECATQRLEEAARIARAQADTMRDVAVPRASSPDVQVGGASLSGSRLRMGSALGHSVRPYRPVLTPGAPFGARR